MTDKKEVIKHSAAIQITNEVTLLQRRTWNCLLANAFDDLDKQDEYSVSLKELWGVLGYRGNNDKHFKQLLLDLMGVKVQWNILNKDQNEWGAMVILPEVRIVNGVLIYGYGPRLRKLLHSPAMYAKISLSLQNKFDSKHALALYELCVDYFDVKRGFGETPWMVIEDFRKLMGVGKDEYVRFKDLSRYVIQKALREINDWSDLQVTADYKKQRRWVREVKFRIRKNPKPVIDSPALPIPDPQLSLGIPEPGEIEDVPEAIDNKGLFHTLQEEFGIHKDKAIEFLKTRDEFYIEEVLTEVRKKIQANKVDDIPGYTVRAIEKDYRRKKTARDQEVEKKKKRTEQAHKDQDLIRKLKFDFDEYVENKAQESYQQLNKKAQDQLCADFEAERIQSNSSLAQAYEKGGLKSRIIQAMYHGYLREKLLSESDRDLVQYAKTCGHNVRQISGDYYELIHQN